MLPKKGITKILMQKKTYINNNSKNYSHFCMNNGGRCELHATAKPFHHHINQLVFPPTLQAMTSSLPEEIMLITNEMFSKLSTCRNKYEQLAVIAEMATKYILNDK
jgi:hypothetical protein